MAAVSIGPRVWTNRNKLATVMAHKSGLEFSISDKARELAGPMHNYTEEIVRNSIESDLLATARSHIDRQTHIERGAVTNWSLAQKTINESRHRCNAESEDGSACS